MTQKLIRQALDVRNSCDFATALSRMMDDIEMFAEFAEPFLQQGPARIKDIVFLVKQGNYQNAAQEIHLLKGAAGQLGCSGLYGMLSSVLTRFHKTREVDQASAQSIQQQFEACTQSLQEFLASFDGEEENHEDH